MSRFLAYESYLVDIGTSVAAWKTQFETALTDQNWQIFDSTDAWTEFIPPATEDIGIPYGNGVLRVYFTSTTVRFETRLRFNETRNSSWTVRSVLTSVNTNSAYDMSLTIGGTTWTVPNADPWTGDSRTQNLYNALVADAGNYPNGRDAYTYTLNTSVSPWVIEFTRIDPASDRQDPFAEASSGLTITRIETSLHPTKTSPYVPFTVPYTTGNYSVSIDLSSGFIYYLSIFERSIVFATKTTLNYYGPIVGTWIDNQLALDQTPDGFVPVELYLVDGSNRNTTNYRFNMMPSHSIGYYKITTNAKFAPENYRLFNASTVSYSQAVKLPLAEVSTSDLGELCMLIPREQQYSRFEGLAHAGGVASYYGELLAPVYSIVNVELFKKYQGNSFSTQTSWAAETTTSFLEDVYMYASTATNESLHLARIVDITTPATANASDIATSIAVSDTSLFPVSGTLIINSEIIQYTSKTATTFSGLSRAQYGTAAGAITTGDTVYATNWFVKINDGAILAGTSKPTAQ